MNCDICLEAFDHSIRRPFVLAGCGHTYCSSCLDQLANKKCSQCRKPFKEKNPNILLLSLIPQSSYDKLKADSLKALSEINEAKQDLKDSRNDKLKLHETRLKSIKQGVLDETARLIGILNENE